MTLAAQIMLAFLLLEGLCLAGFQWLHAFA